MLLDWLYECGLLLTAMVAGFALSASVGLIVASLAGDPHSLSSEPEELGLTAFAATHRPWRRPGAVREARTRD
jgi:hypothetical protein